MIARAAEIARVENQKREREGAPTPAKVRSAGDCRLVRQENKLLKLQGVVRPVKRYARIVPPIPLLLQLLHFELECLGLLAKSTCLLLQIQSL
jgi:hypothetical protein